MKSIDIPLIQIAGATSLEQAFNNVFSKETLQKVHGSSLKLTEWKNNERRITFEVDTLPIPKEMKRFLCGDKLLVTTRQSKKIKTKKEDTFIEVSNHIKMHFLGSEFFMIKPKFIISKCNQTIQPNIYISGKVDHHALLPPPLNTIAEKFMMEHSKIELQKWSEVISEIYGLVQ